MDGSIGVNARPDPAPRRHGMMTNLVKWASNDGQIFKSRLSDGRGAIFLPSGAEVAYDWLQIDGKIAVPTIYRFENLLSTYGDIVDEFSLTVNNMPHAKKKEGKPNYKPFYDETRKAIVNRLYAGDISEWNYNFENSS